MLFGGYFDSAIFNLEGQNPVEVVGREFHGAGAFVLHSFTAGFAVYLAAAGAFVAWFLYLKRPDIPARLATQFHGLYNVLVNKYYFDWFNENVLMPAARGLGFVLWKVGDQAVIDGAVVNGSAKAVGLLAGVTRGLQSGYLYHYAFAMIVGLAALVGWLVFQP